MKLIIFSIVILFSLQGCSAFDQARSFRYIKSCHLYTVSSTVKQCEKDKKIVTEILGEGALVAENQQRRFIAEFTLSWLALFDSIIH